MNYNKRERKENNERGWKREGEREENFRGFIHYLKHIDYDQWEKRQETTETISKRQIPIGDNPSYLLYPVNSTIIGHVWSYPRLCMSQNNVSNESALNWLLE